MDDFTLAKEARGEEISSASIGYIGCSNTKQTVYGYHAVGGKNIWVGSERRLHDYDGGAVIDWARGAEKGKGFWKVFDRYLAENPHTTAVWWQLCIRKDEAEMTYDNAVPILHALRKRIPHVTIYVSPLAEYAENVCEITGMEGIERATSLAQELDSRNDDVFPGPVLGPLYLSEITDKEKDRCHLNEEGMRKLGEHMKKFFDVPLGQSDGASVGESTSGDNVENGQNLSDDDDDVFRVQPVNTSGEFLSSGKIVELLTPEQTFWKRRIDAAFTPSNCSTVSGEKYGSFYYSGPLIDTHYHIPSIPDDPFEEGSGGENDDDADDGGHGDDDDDDDGGNADDDNNRSGDNVDDDDDDDEDDEDDQMNDVFPSLGENIKITDIVCALQQEGTKKVFAFFPVYPELPQQLLQVVNKALQLYPETFVPFIMPPDGDNEPGGFPTVDADVFVEMLSVYPGLFQGYGEIGLYERDHGAAELLPDSPRLREIYPIIRKNKLVVYFHLGKGQKYSFERALEQNPDINFIWHGDQLSVDHIEDILSKHPNAFYTVDELYGDVWLLRNDVTKETFLAHFEKYQFLLDTDLSTWRGPIERHPDQFMWGTDRGGIAVWTFDPEVGKALSNYGRAFIARLDPAVQEKFAYKNAEKLLR